MNELALLQALLDQPADLTTTLIYADWLDEHGDTDRAQLIRLECALRSPPKIAAKGWLKRTLSSVFGNRDAAQIAQNQHEVAFLPTIQNLWLDHADEWCNWHGWPLTVNQAVGIAQRRLAEAILWERLGILWERLDLPRENGRTIALIAPYATTQFNWIYDFLINLQQRVEHVLQQRQRIVDRILAEDYRDQRREPARDLAGGRLAVFDQRYWTYDEAAEIASDGFFDRCGFPAWDGWIADGCTLFPYPGRIEQFPDELARGHFIIVWVTPQQLERADRGIRATADGSLRWLDEVPTPSPFVRQLLTAVS